MGQFTVIINILFWFQILADCLAGSGFEPGTLPKSSSYDNFTDPHVRPRPWTSDCDFLILVWLKLGFPLKLMVGCLDGRAEEEVQDRLIKIARRDSSSYRWTGN
jgi:hypothetical protein